MSINLSIGNNKKNGHFPLNTVLISIYLFHNRIV